MSDPNEHIDNQEDYTPADDAGMDDDFEFDFTGLTDEEIQAINADDGDSDDDHEEGESQPDDRDDTDSDADGDNGSDVEDGADSEREPARSDSDVDGGADSADLLPADADWQKQVAQTTNRRAEIDAQYEAKLNELDELGKKYDAGDIYDGAYNAQRARIERELKRIEALESDLVVKEDAIATRQQDEQAQFQQQFTSAVESFMAKPENSVFVEGSAEFEALDKQLGFVASSMPPGTPFDVLLNKARAAVGAFMELPEAEAKAAPQKTAGKKDDPIMPSISGMPAVVPNNANDDNKFAHLDKLSGDKLERALADMTPDQQNEYLMQ